MSHFLFLYPFRTVVILLAVFLHDPGLFLKYVCVTIAQNVCYFAVNLQKVQIQEEI